MSDVYKCIVGFTFQHLLAFNILIYLYRNEFIYSESFISIMNLDNKALGKIKTASKILPSSAGLLFHE